MGGDDRAAAMSDVIAYAVTLVRSYNAPPTHPTVLTVTWIDDDMDECINVAMSAARSIGMLDVGVYDEDALDIRVRPVLGEALR